MELTQELLLKWLKGLSQLQPTLFIVEDLHWSDASTQGLLTQMVDSFSSGQLMSLLTFRPEFETPWASSPHQTQIALNRLPKRQMTKMIHERTGRKDIPEALINQLIERTDGILRVSQPDTLESAEEQFMKAIEVAQSQEARSWELRAATSLAKLLQSTGRTDEARSKLQPVYDWFTEGLDTEDLVEAREFLSKLS
ncbi:MAG: hypothetical protein CMJ78_09870 [Planctomycetaceae bacterium]|nr:hypothetical protein [Planctomycetaceae bacterium]